MSADRPYFDKRLKELRALIEDAARSADTATLKAIRAELSHRSSQGSLKLRDELDAILAAPSPPAEPSPPSEPSPPKESRKGEEADAPSCPECGKEMVLRTAKRGRNAGGQFWGCPGFPDCRGLVPYPSDGTPQDAETGEKETGGDGSPIVGTHPVRFTATPVEPQLQVDFFESVGLPHELVALLNLDDVPTEVVRAFAGWRLDFPPPNGSRPTGPESTLLALAENLLLRGTAPLCVPTVEKELTQTSGIEWDAIPAPQIEAALQMAARHPLSPHVPGAFDSPEEEELVRAIRDELGSRRSGWAIQSQVHATSLNPGMPADSRCDLLLTHPEAPPLVVELDGAQHQGHISADQQYKEAIEAAGIAVIRLPVSEFRARSGSAWSEVRSRIEAPTTADGDPSLQSLLARYKVVHQIQVAVLRGIRMGHLPLREEWAVEVDLPGDLDVALTELAVEGLREILERLSRLWGIDPIRPAAIEVGRTQGSPTTGLRLRFPHSSSAYQASDVPLPRPPLREAASGSALKAPPAPSRSDAEWCLSWLFRKAGFWEGQWECVQRARTPWFSCRPGGGSPSPISSQRSCGPGPRSWSIRSSP